MTQSNNILAEVQREVVADIISSPQLSTQTVLAENQRDIEYEVQKALAQQGLVTMVMTPKATYLGDYNGVKNAWEIEELVVQTVENVPVNRGKSTGILSAETMTGQDVSMAICEWLCKPSLQRKYIPRTYEQGEDNGLLVSKMTLRCAVYS